jgi:hypothetical protein
MRQILLFIAYAVGLVPFLLYNIKKNKSLDVKALSPFINLLALACLYEFIVTGQFRIDTLIWFKIYSFLEFISIYFFFETLSNHKYNKLLRLYFWIFILVYVGLQINWLMGGKSNTDSWLSIIETLFVYNAAYLWFKETFTNMSLTTLWASPAFYFISGFILYFSGTLFLFLMSDFVFTPQEMNKHWIINVILSLLLSIIIILGIWKSQRKSHQYSG